MRVTLIVAAAKNSVIGRGAEIPWRLPKDQKFFRSQTLGHCIVMGRKTFDSIGKPLPGRTNLVLTRSRPEAREGVHFFAALLDAEDWALREGFEELFVIGGEAVYREAMDRADRIFLTRVDAAPEGDVFFPEIDPSLWECQERDAYSADERHAHDFVIERWERRD